MKRDSKQLIGVIGGSTLSLIFLSGFLPNIPQWLLVILIIIGGVFGFYVGSKA